MMSDGCAGMSVAARTAMSSLWLDVRHALRARWPGHPPVLGILAAAWGVDAAVALIPGGAPRAGEIALDRGAIGFALACMIGAALAFGLAPIAHARRADLHGALKDGSARTTASRGRLRARRTLVIAQIALAVVLVVASTLTVRIYAKLSCVELGFELGFEPDRLLTFDLALADRAYPGVTGDALWHRLEDRLRALPGVTSAGLISGLPPGRRSQNNAFAYLDRPWRPFAGVDPIGARLRMRPGAEREQRVVGIVKDIVQHSLDRPPGTEVFFPLAQARHLADPPHARAHLYAVVRTRAAR
jgi:hypothetical protein